MAHKTSLSPPRYSLDPSDSQLEHEGDLNQDFLDQNELISQEIWKCDKSLYCPTRTFKVLALIYLYSFITYIVSFIKDKTNYLGIGGYLPKYLFYLYFVVSLFLFLMSMWACFISWRSIYSKDPLKLSKPILVFKSYFCFVIGVEAPIGLYHMAMIGWSSGSKIFSEGCFVFVGDAIVTGTSLLLVMRIKNILLKHKPFHDASSFYANSNASFMNQKV